MNFISLFSGIGGIDLGLERAGMTCVAQVENDPFCNKVLEKHWPSVPRFGDIRNVGKHNLPAAELVCGGFPCQPFSNAGNRKGDEDDRYLWPEMFRVVQELKPAWFFGENVAGIINMALDTVLFDLESEGYTCETFVIPACAVNAPHRRDRVWIVAYTNGSGCVHGQPEINTTEARKYALSEPFASGKDVANPNSKRGRSGIAGEQNAKDARKSPGSARGFDWWDVEPAVGRVAHGVPGRMDRLRSLGNAVVPQVVEEIGRVIMTFICSQHNENHFA